LEKRRKTMASKKLNKGKKIQPTKTLSFSKKIDKSS